MISLAIKPSPALLRPRLGQAGLDLTILVVDANGRPVPDAAVSVYSSGKEVASGTSDRHGMVKQSLVPGGFLVTADYDGMMISKAVAAEDVSLGQTIFLSFPICVTGPLIKPVEIAFLAGALIFTAAGMYWKVEPLKVVGEIVFGTAAFTVLFRLSCV